MTKKYVLDKKLSIYIDRPYRVYVDDIIDDLRDLSYTSTTELILEILSDKLDNNEYIRKLIHELQETQY
jgi:hypothetical protein